MDRAAVGRWRYRLRLDWSRRKAHVRLPERTSRAPCRMPSKNFWLFSILNGSRKIFFAGAARKLAGNACSAGLWSRKPSSRRPARLKDARRIRCMAIFFCRAIQPCQLSMKSTGSVTGRVLRRGAATQSNTAARFSLSRHRSRSRSSGLEHAVSMPKVPLPESLPSEFEMLQHFGAVMPEAIRRWFAQDRPIEVRPVDLPRYMRHEAGAPEQYVWLRASGPLPSDPAIHRAVLAYLSDMTLLDAVLGAHGHSVFDSGLQIASLDHALWFHRPFRADAWLLYAQDSPTSCGARGFARGLLFTDDGRLVASVVQEGLIRPTPSGRGVLI